MASAVDESFDLSAVPLFPLPNVVLFPRAVLPSHIFEERYKAMAADTLSGRGQIAMALLKPGWEKNYYQRPPIEPVVCAGRILSHEKLADGTYNFLLEGVLRARIVQEFDGKPYRIAELEPLEESLVMEVDLEEQRRRLHVLFDEAPSGYSGISQQFRQLVRSPFPTAQIADLVAFNFLEDLALRQGILSETDVRKRVSRTIDALAATFMAIGSDPSSHEPQPGLN
jgi:Lon protease-like protein